MQALHLLFHVHPRHKGSLTPPVFVAVEQLVQDFFAQKGHADLIGIREAERHAHINVCFIFIGAARFTAGITARLLNQTERFFQLRGKFGHVATLPYPAAQVLTAGSYCSFIALHNFSILYNSPKQRKMQPQFTQECFWVWILKRNRIPRLELICQPSSPWIGSRLNAPRSRLAAMK